MDPEQLQELLLQHFDKLALGLAGLFAVWAFGFGYLLAPDPVAGAQRRLADVTDDISDQVADAREIPRTPPNLSHARSVRGRFEALPDASAGPAWLAAKKPHVHVRHEGGDPGVLRHDAPRLAGEAERGQVRLEWTPQVRNVVVRSYELWRTDDPNVARDPGGESAGWTLVTDDIDPVAQQEYADEDVEPQTRYWYYLVSRAEADHNADTIQDWQRLEEDERTRTSRVVGPFETPRDYIIVPASIDVPGPDVRAQNPQAENEALLHVYTWNQGEGGWTRERVTVHEEDEFEVQGRTLRVDAIKNLEQAEAEMVGGNVRRWDETDNPDRPVRGVVLRDLNKERRLTVQLIRERNRQAGRGDRDVTEEEVEEFRLTREEERQVQALWRPPFQPVTREGGHVFVEEPPAPRGELHPLPTEENPIDWVERIEIPARGGGN